MMYDLTHYIEDEIVEEIKIAYHDALVHYGIPHVGAIRDMYVVGMEAKIVTYVKDYSYEDVANIPDMYKEHLDIDISFVELVLMEHHYSFICQEGILRNKSFEGVW